MSLKSELCTEVIELIKEVAEITDSKAITDKSKIVSLGIDSIKFMNLLIGLEDIIDCDIEDVIEDVDFSEFKTVEDIVEFVLKVKESS